MISLHIEDEVIKNILLTQYETTEKINQYLYELIVEDLEEKVFTSAVRESHHKDYIDKNKVFETLQRITWFYDE